MSDPISINISSAGMSSALIQLLSAVSSNTDALIAMHAGDHEKSLEKLRESNEALQQAVNIIAENSDHA